ncbi:MAG: STAS domain-containing protein [Pseudonocardiales bacterium]|nr:STAS domain-containing protein [Pseudonocardiales bacterium]
MCHAISPDTGQVACFDVTVFTDAARSCLVLHGELDLSTAAGLEQVLDRLRGAGHHQITVDVSGLEFLSAAGLTVFLRADEALGAVGGRLVLTRPTRMARRVLAITGLDTTLSIQPSRG